MDRIGGTFGMFSPRSLSELELQTMMLPQVSEQLRTYARRWQEALDALKLQNFERFLAADPEWRDAPRRRRRSTRSTTPAAAQLARELLAALVPFTEADRETYERLQLLKQRADAAGAAAYRMEVRLGVVLRMRALLDADRRPRLPGGARHARGARHLRRPARLRGRQLPRVTRLRDRRRHGSARRVPAARRGPPGRRRR